MMAIMTFIAVISFGNLIGAKDSQDVKGAGQQVVTALRDAQNRAISGEGSGNWGVHFDNTTSTSPFYAVVSGTIYSASNVFSEAAMPAGTLFIGLPASSSLDVFFSSLTGRPASTTILTIGKKSSSKGGISDVLIKNSGQISSSYDSGLVGYWHFDEGSGASTTDASGWGNNGNLVSSPAWQIGSNCKSGSCLSFNGTSNYISVPASNTINPSKLTIAGWFNVNTFSSAAEQGFLDKESQYGVYIWSNKIEFDLSYSWNGQQYASATITPGNWYFVATTFDGTNQKIYLNGSLLQSFNAPGSISTNGNIIAIGSGGANGSGYRFNGFIDEVRVYNRTLSASEILNQYNTLK